MRVAIYARYSSDLQDVRSIADQIALARERAAREGWAVVGVYEDAAISGAAIVNRPGLLKLLADAACNTFDAVLTEDLDRLSRDQEDTAGIHKRLAFLGLKIVTLADGEVSKLHVGIKGLLSSLYIENLAQKTRRGQIGRVAAGRIPGGRCYGYDVVPGEDRGLRTINEAEAEIIRRIFREYLTGTSPLAIARHLNQQGVPGPSGRHWTASTLNGSRKRGNGVLSNNLYVGEIVYNRQRFIKDPETGKRQARLNPPSEWRRQSVPELAIIDPKTWADVQSIRRAHVGQTHHRRPKRLLSGLMTCGCCGGSYIIKTRNYIGCSRYMNTGTCTNGRQIQIEEVERRVIDAVRAHLLSPEEVARAVEAYREERMKVARERLAKARAAERDAAEVDRKIARLVSAIEDGADAGPLIERLKELEARKRDLTDAVGPSKADVVMLHPQAAGRYRAKIEALHAALAKTDASAESAKLFRELVMEVRITPNGRSEPVTIDIIGDLAALMEPKEGKVVTSSVVAGTCNHQCSHDRTALFFKLAG